jgi:hypothetical protein
MMLNRRLTGALAWGGLALILGVPSAEMLSAKVDGTAVPEGARTVGETATDPIKTASIATPASGTAVDDYLATGKALPDYISGGPAPAPKRIVPATGSGTLAPAANAQQQPGAITAAPVQTATGPQTIAPLPPQPAPIPMPAWMRPNPPATQVAAVPPVTTPPPVDAGGQVMPQGAVAAAPQAVAPVETPPVQPMPIQSAPAQVAAVPPAAAPVVLDEPPAPKHTASTRPVPPASIPDGQVVTEDQLDDWDSGSLADYLQRRGLMSDASYGNGQPQADDSEYDGDGFFLSDGPNNNRRAGRNRYIVVFPRD